VCKRILAVEDRPDNRQLIRWSTTDYEITEQSRSSGPTSF
jgi:hypothetical protein